MARTETIHSLVMKASRGIKASLKARGIIVADVEGPSDEPHLRSLQELQAIHQALDESDKAAAQVQAFNTGEGWVNQGASGDLSSDSPISPTTLTDAGKTKGK
jgi:hypothetical protein